MKNLITKSNVLAWIDDSLDGLEIFDKTERMYEAHTESTGRYVEVTVADINGEAPARVFRISVEEV